MPEPPNSVGTATPASPSCPACAKVSRGKSPVWSIRAACGRTTSSANSRTEAWRSACSSVSSRFMGGGVYRALPRSGAGERRGVLKRLVRLSLRIQVGLRATGDRVFDDHRDVDVRQTAREHPILGVDAAAVQDLDDQLD